MRQKRISLDALSSALDRLDTSPLQPISYALRPLLIAAKDDAVSENIPGVTIECINWFVESLPCSFGDRFFFDTKIVQGIANEWSNGHVKLSNMIVPRPHDSWGHLSMAMPSSDSTRTHIVNLILMPGEDTLEEIDLLNYPFVHHELAHNLMFREDKWFSDQFQSELNSFLSNLRMQGIADQGQARAVADQQIRRIEEVWTPTPNHRNWAHEIAADMIALWTCGMAYAQTFLDEIQRPGLDPHMIETDYPPYVVRALTLSEQCDDLGWSTEAANLRKILRVWNDTNPSINEFAALTISDIRDKCRSVSTAYCRFCSLPQCIPQDVDRLRGALSNKVPINIGTDLLLAARITKLDSAITFDSWQKGILAELCSDPADEV